MHKLDKLCQLGNIINFEYSENFPNSGFTSLIFPIAKALEPLPKIAKKIPASQIIFDLHPGFSHLEDEKGNKLHLFKKYFKMMFFYYTSHHWSLLLFIFIAFCVTKAFAKKN